MFKLCLICYCIPHIMNIVGVVTVQGKIISFNEHDNSGSIIADDGIQYIFNGNNWVEHHLPKAGDNIDFSFDSNTGSINRLSYQSQQTRTGTLSSLSNNDRPSLTPPSLQKVSQDRYAPPSQSIDNQGFNHQHDSDLDVRYAEEENYSLIDWTKKVVFNNYANFSGRARRKEYWLFYLATIIVSMVLGFFEGLMSSSANDFSMLSVILSLILLVPTLAVGARRLHDTGRSGWWQLLWFIPIIGWILLIVWLAKDTSPEINKWGPPARRV